MADQADVEQALAAIAANALYPEGTAAPSVLGVNARVFRGWPAAPTLQADLAAGAVQVSVSGTDAGLRNVTRYPRAWQVVRPVGGTLAVAVSGVRATFSGSCALGQLAGVLADGQSFAYAVQASDSAATVASNLAAQIGAAGWLVNYAGSGLTLPAAEHFTARVVFGAGSLLELRRQVQAFRLAMWCADPATRDALAALLDGAMMAQNFIALADGSYGRVRFSHTVSSDDSENAGLFRRDLIYDVEYPTTQAQQTPAMLFGTMTATVDTVVLGNYLS